LGWAPLFDLDATLTWTVEWYSEALNSASFDAQRVTTAQIDRYLKLDDDRTRLGAPSAPTPSTASRH
jgi:hypothetical protein